MAKSRHYDSSWKKAHRNVSDKRNRRVMHDIRRDPDTADAVSFTEHKNEALAWQ